MKLWYSAKGIMDCLHGKRRCERGKIGVLVQIENMVLRGECAGDGEPADRPTLSISFITKGT